jgi:hypothetical protein
MFGKLFVTLVVIAVVYGLIQTRLRRGSANASSEPRRPIVSPRAFRVIAYGLLGSMLIGTLAWLILDWETGRQVVIVRVINSDTGSTTLYRARRSDVSDGRRFFTTIDGRQILLANVERMVVEESK